MMLPSRMLHQPLATAVDKVLVTMNNFAVTDARDACFNFAENTVAVLTGTANNPSTMTRCNTNENDWGGAIVNMPGSTAGSLTLRHVDIVDSEVSLIRTDLQMITISDVSATMTNGDVNPRVTGQGQWAYDNSGVHLGLSHGQIQKLKSLTSTHLITPTAGFMQQARLF